LADFFSLVGSDFSPTGRPMVILPPDLTYNRLQINIKPGRGSTRQVELVCRNLNSKRARTCPAQLNSERVHRGAEKTTFCSFENPRQSSSFKASGEDHLHHLFFISIETYCLIIALIIFRSVVFGRHAGRAVRPRVGLRTHQSGPI